MTKDSLAAPSFLLVGSIAFVAGGVWMILSGNQLGWGVSLFFGACTVFAVAKVWPAISGFGRTDPGSVDSVLDHFPGPTKLNASRRKWLVMLFIAIALNAAMTLYLIAPNLSWRKPDPLIGLLGVLLTGWWIIRSGLRLLPGASALILDSEGFELIKFFRRSRVKWKDTTGFTTLFTQLPGFQTGYWVVIHYSESQKDRLVKAKGDSDRNSRIPDTYGLSPQNLASLMNQWRERALQSKS